MLLSMCSPILKAKVDEDTPGMELLHHENHVKIHCRLGGVGEDMHMGHSMGTDPGEK